MEPPTAKTPVITIAKPKLPPDLPARNAPSLENGLKLENAEIIAAGWAGESARLATFDVLRLAQPDLTATKLRESGWSDVQISGGQLGGLDLTNGAWRRVTVSGARLSGVVLVEAELRDVTFADAKLDLANLRFAKLTRVQFLRCQLTEADFAGAQLTDVSFTGCDLTASSFAGATLEDVDLRTSTLRDLHDLAGLRGATIDTEQLIGLAPELAETLGLKVAD
ncbi:MAG: pentapeptide repeat-containing protein [Patescibacteria group bacterium]|nr:pentapeptide repeat-containing protein [Patescibacteria group bacterium]